MPTKNKGQEIDSKRLEELNGIAEKFRSRIDPDEWRFAFQPFVDENEIVGCFIWEYIREHPDLPKTPLDSSAMTVVEFLFELLCPYYFCGEATPLKRHRLRREFYLFYKGIPARVITALVDYAGEMRPWLLMSRKERNAILNTPIRPALIPAELILLDEMQHETVGPQSFGIPKKSGIYNEYPNGFPWRYDSSQNLLAKFKAVAGGGRKTAFSSLPHSASRLMAVLNSFIVKPDFLVNFMDYEAEELKRALSEWVDQRYPQAMRIRQKRGAFKIRDVRANLKRLAVMRLMNKFRIQELQDAGVRRFDEDSDRDFYDDRIQAGKTFSKYFAFRDGQEPLNYLQFGRRKSNS